MKSILSIFLLIIISSCGFKIVSVSEQNNFSVIDLSSNGDKRVNYIIRNKILDSSKKNSVNRIIIDLNTNKTKTVKEKNIRNEITKYEISITANIKFGKEENIKQFNFIKTNKNDYDVNKQYSQTRNNEKKLTELLSENLADEIITEISKRMNDI